MFPAAPIFMGMQLCPMFTPFIIPIPHVGGPIVGPGAPTVIIGGVAPGSVMGDLTICVGPPGSMVKGSCTVMLLNRPSVRMLDMTAHGGVVLVGMPTVLVGG